MLNKIGTTIMMGIALLGAFFGGWVLASPYLSFASPEPTLTSTQADMDLFALDPLADPALSPNMQADMDLFAFGSHTDRAQPQAIGRAGNGMMLMGMLRVTADVCNIEVSDVVDGLLADKSLAQIAAEHGKTDQELIDAMVAKARERLDEAVANGRITQERADTMLERMENRAADLIQHTDLGDRLMQGVERMARMGLTHATANVTGLELRTVHTRIQNGESPADIAVAEGHTDDEVVQTLLTNAGERLDLAMVNGVITENEADTMLKLLTQAAEEQVNQTW
ncbi:MAG: hypothetical protein HC837_17660 [Chloroflexaceae bacterium]|nr:hypothetical protein [Chloroflexaceae bacterium]